jgi:hypothetical protein
MQKLLEIVFSNIKSIENQKLFLIKQKISCCVLRAKFFQRSFH